MSELPITMATDVGTIEYTNAGQADADLASAGMALEGLLRRSDLTAVQRRDFVAALRWTRRAAQAIGRHVNYGET
jgi:hypothetical protein